MMWIPGYRRHRLADAAKAYAAAGWPVAPGAWWDPSEKRYRCAPTGCLTEGLHPTLPDLRGATRRCQVIVEQAATRDVGTVDRRWGRRPHSVLLPTGQVCDAIELGPTAARRVQAVLAAQGSLGPVATFPDETVLLFTGVAEPGTDLADELHAACALHHGRGSWVPLPPSQLATGPMRWTRSPGAARWRLPSLRRVVETLRVALASASPAEGT